MKYREGNFRLLPLRIPPPQITEMLKAGKGLNLLLIFPSYFLPLFLNSGGGAIVPKNLGGGVPASFAPFPSPPP